MNTKEAAKAYLKALAHTRAHSNEPQRLADLDKGLEELDVAAVKLEQAMRRDPKLGIERRIRTEYKLRVVKAELKQYLRQMNSFYEWVDADEAVFAGLSTDPEELSADNGPTLPPTSKEEPETAEKRMPLAVAAELLAWNLRDGMYLEQPVQPDRARILKNGRVITITQDSRGQLVLDPGKEGTPTYATKSMMMTVWALLHRLKADTAILTGERLDEALAALVEKTPKPEPLPELTLEVLVRIVLNQFRQEHAPADFLHARLSLDRMAQWLRLSVGSHEMTITLRDAPIGPKIHMVQIHVSEGCLMSTERVAQQVRDLLEPALPDHKVVVTYAAP